MLNPTTPKAPWNTRPSRQYTTDVSRNDHVNAPYETGEDDLDPEQDDQADEELGQTAYVDEKGWFYADKDTIQAVDEIIACEDEYFAQMLINYRAARDALTHARIVHGFFPVEVPADDGRQPRFSQTNKTGVKKTGTPTSAYVSRTNAVPGTSSGSTFMNTTPGKSSSSASWNRKNERKGKSFPICYFCGKHGHLPRDCTHRPPTRKTRPEPDLASVIFDEPSRIDRIRERLADLRRQAELDQQNLPDPEPVNGLEETKGCAILDSGATVMCSSTVAAEEIQMQRRRQNEPGDPSVRSSDRCFRFADGSTSEVQNMVEQPITAGLLQGKTIRMHLIDCHGNETSPLFSIDDQRRYRMVVDYEENKVMFKDKPDTWHTLPTTKKGLMMIPLTKEACERQVTTATPSTTRWKRHRKKDLACHETHH